MSLEELKRVLFYYGQMLITPRGASAAIIPIDTAAAHAIKQAKHDPEMRAIIKKAQQRREKVTVRTGQTAFKGTGTTGGYDPIARDINLSAKGEQDTGVLGHEMMHFLSQVSRSPFWHPLRLNEYLAEYGGTAGDPSAADPGYEYGKLPRHVQEAIKKEFKRILSQPRDYVRPKQHRGKIPETKYLSKIVDFWLSQPPLSEFK